MYRASEGAELLGDNQWRVIGQHYAAAADADSFRRVCDVADEDWRRRAGKAFDGVVFGKPEAAVTPLLGVTREIDGSRQ